MEKKCALITGSTSGIGLGIAKKLALNGYHIILNGFGEPSLIDDLKAELKAHSGHDVYHYHADLTDVNALEAMIQAIQKEVGPIDVLVNNAGVQHVCPIIDFPLEKWRQIMALDLEAIFHTTRLVLPAMKEKGWGRIINIASAHALVASPFKSAYVTAKHGVAGLTKVTALEAAEWGITANAVCPGYVYTPLVENQIDATARARGISRESVIRDVMLGNQATKQFVKIEEVAALVDFLASPLAGSITGAAIPIDGGWTAH